MSESVDTALVRIRTQDGKVTGAGFLIGERYILTCAHVVAQALGLSDDPLDPPQSQVCLDFPQLPTHELLTARVIFWRPVQSANMGDIAGLELPGQAPQGAKATHLVPAEEVWDHQFRAMGFPNGFDDGVWATGHLLGKQANGWVQLEDIKIPGFPVMSGFSGSPVWDTQLQGVVGMVVAASQGSTTKTAFAIPSDALISVWPQINTLMRPPEPRNPYKGLKAFDESDARYFFGRETLVEELGKAMTTALTLERKDAPSARLLAIIGPSGSGKSSVAKAGLFPYLRRGGIFNSEEWVYLKPMVPGMHPLENLSVSLAKELHRDAPSIHEKLKESSRNLHLMASELVSSPDQRVVLLIDQFEDVFTLTTSEKERQQFFELLIAAATEPQGPLFVVLTLRADFYDRPMHYPILFRLIDGHHTPVLPLEMNELRSVIEQPVKLPEVQLVFERGLVDELVFATQGQSGALPLLEFTLDQLVENRNGYQLTFQAYREMGGVKGALSQHAEKTYQGLPSNEHRQMAREIFLRLINPGLTEQDTTRRRAARSEFAQDEPVQDQRMQETLNKFIDARLLTTDQVDGKTTVEVSHEALIREWKRLAEWLHEARGDIQFQQSLSDDAVEWEQHKRPGDRLYRGSQLREAQAWARRNRPNKTEMAFLRASAARRLLQFAVTALALLALVSSLGIAGWFIFFQPNPALVTTLQDNQVGSLRWCIDHASSGSTTIRFAQGLRGIIELTGGDLVFPGNKVFTLIGPGENQLSISGGNLNAKIHIAQGATLSVSGLSFVKSETVIDAFLFNEGKLTVTNSIISGNRTGAGATAYGGGIENRGTLTVINSTISNNSSISDNSVEGGGIFNEGRLTVIQSTFFNNSASSSNNYAYGGAIDNTKSGNATVTDSTFSGNTANGAKFSVAYGGAIENEGKLTLTSSKFLYNLASTPPSSGFLGGTSYGGGIYNAIGGVMTITGSIFSKNIASGQFIGAGGGIDNAGQLTVNEGTFTGNSVSSSGSYNTFTKNISGGEGFGGAIYDSYTDSITKVTASLFEDNTVNGNQYAEGGGIDNEAQLSVTQSTFLRNAVSNSGGIGYGGGIYNSYSYNPSYSVSPNTTNTVVTDSLFSGNIANGKLSGDGGGVYSGSDLTVVNTTFWKNMAMGRGGGIFSSGNKSSFAIVSFCTLFANTSNTGGGILIAPSGSGKLMMTADIIADNSAQAGPDISGVLVSNGYNLVGNFSGSTGLLPRIDKQVTVADLDMQQIPEDNNGSPQTLALLPQSQAVDAVPGPLCSVTITAISGQQVTIDTDQRGEPRPGGSDGCDSGAYESPY